MSHYFSAISAFISFQGISELLSKQTTLKENQIKLKPNKKCPDYFNCSNHCTVKNNGFNVNQCNFIFVFCGRGQQPDPPSGVNFLRLFALSDEISAKQISVPIYFNHKNHVIVDKNIFNFKPIKYILSFFGGRGQWANAKFPLRGALMNNADH